MYHSKLLIGYYTPHAKSMLFLSSHNLACRPLLSVLVFFVYGYILNQFINKSRVKFSALDFKKSLNSVLNMYETNFT